MSTSSRALIVLLLLVVVGSVLVFRAQKSTPVQTPLATAHYLCSGGKTIDAAFYEGSSTPGTADTPPIPGGSVALMLSDGRAMTLKQTLSADGVRYSNGDPMTQGSETFVFWSKGNGAIVLENNEEKSFVGCVVVAPQPAGSDLTQAYATSSMGFSIRYPQGFTLDESYRYQEMGPGKDIAGVKFTIPAPMAAGTNLGSDSYLSIETLPQVQDCKASLFLEGATPREVTDNGTTYSVASTTGAGAGNRYEETVYAFPGTNPCLAIRYFVHYSVFENYPSGAVTRFDHTALIGEFDAIRRTLTLQ